MSNNADSDDEESLLPEPEPEPGIYVQAGEEADGDLRRMKATRVNEDGSTETKNQILQLTDRGKRNLMIALYGPDAVFQAEERFHALQRGPDVERLTSEINDWRARFAMLAIEYEEPHIDLLLLYVQHALTIADADLPNEARFPYGPNVYDWPDEVRSWFAAFTKAFIRKLLVPSSTV